MELLESKREYNNILLRRYYSSNNKEKYYKEILEFNIELIPFTIQKYFSNLEYKEEFYEIGIVSLIRALENYKMDQIADFESFIVANIKNDISNFILSNYSKVDINDQFNIGDLLYNQFHLLNETLDTKNDRDELAKKVLSKNIFK